jgi:hypothetical protein
VLLNTTPHGATTLSFTAPQVFAAGTSTFFGSLGQGSLAVADINADGRPDVLVANPADVGSPANVGVLLNTTPSAAATVSFNAQQAFLMAGIDNEFVAAADANGDGRPDLIGLSTQGSLQLNTTSPGAASPSFAAPQYATIVSNQGSWGQAVADFNGDGKADVAFTLVNISTFAVGVMLSAYNGAFTGRTCLARLFSSCTVFTTTAVAEKVRVF